MKEALQNLEHAPGVMLRSVTKWQLVPGFDRYAVSEDGRVWSSVKPGLLKPYLNQTQTYQIVKLYPGPVQRSVHSLVLEAFRGPPAQEDGETQVAHHKNENPTDNRLQNLEYVTPEENRNLAECGREVCDDTVSTALDREENAPF